MEHSKTIDPERESKSKSVIRTASSIREDLLRQTSNEHSIKYLHNQQQQQKCDPIKCLPNTNVAVDFSSFKITSDDSEDSNCHTKPFPFLIPYPSSLISIQNGVHSTPKLVTHISSTDKKKDKKSSKLKKENSSHASLVENILTDSSSSVPDTSEELGNNNSFENNIKIDKNLPKFDTELLSQIIDKLQSKQSIGVQTLSSPTINDCQTVPNGTLVITQKNSQNNHNLKVQLEQMTYLVEEMSRERSKHNIDMHQLQKELILRDASLERLQKQNREFSQEMLQLVLAREKMELLLDDYRKRIRELQCYYDENNEKIARNDEISRSIQLQHENDQVLIKNLQDNNQKADEKIVELENRICSVSNRIQQQNQEYFLLKKNIILKLNYLQTDLKTLKNEFFIGFKNFIENFHLNNDYEPQIQKIVEEYQNSKQCQIESIENELLNKDLLIKSLEDNIENIEKNSKQINNEYEELKNSKEKLNKELEETKHRLAIRENEFETLLNEMNDLKNEKHQKIDELQGEIEEQKKLFHSLEIENLENKNEIESLRSQIKNAKIILLKQRLQNENQVRDLIDSIVPERESERPYGDIRATIREIKDELSLLKESFLS